MNTFDERIDHILKKTAEQQRLRKRKKIILSTCVSACFVLLIALNLFLFIPYQINGNDISAYKNNEYYEVIYGINKLTYGEPKTTNNFRRLARRLFPIQSEPPTDGNLSQTVETPDIEEPKDSYKELTDNRTEGVIEGDLFKRKDNFIFYLGCGYDSDDDRQDDLSSKAPANEYASVNSYKLFVYTINGTESALTATLTLSPEAGMTYRGYSQSNCEMFLTTDCKSVIILAPCYNSERGIRYTDIIYVDVTDVTEPKEIGHKYISGKVTSSRLVDNRLLLFSDFVVNSMPDFSQPCQYLPQFGDINDMRAIPMKNIVCPKDPLYAEFTVIANYDIAERDITDAIALFSFSQNIYVSADHIFATRQFGVNKVDYIDGEHFALKKVYRLSMTEFRCISYKEDGFVFTGSFELEGIVLDQYCMDEYNNVFRVFTTTTYFYTELSCVIEAGYENVLSLPDKAEEFASKCNLYCVNLSDFTPIAQKEDFAPHNETIRSARFSGTKAYACTAIALSDPVFCFDLSDYNNIGVSDTGTITGYSIALRTFKDNTLIGVGYDENMMLKIEVYREITNPLNGEKYVRTIAVFKKDVYFSETYKSYFINPDLGLIGLGTSDGYILLRFDGYTLSIIRQIDLEDTSSANLSCVRSTCIDNFLYVFSGNEFYFAEWTSDKE